FICSILISLIFVGAGAFIPGLVLEFMGADKEILETGLPYMRITLLFAPCFILNYTFTSFVRNDNAPNIAMVATLSSSIFNIIFDYIFMFPLKMGLSGAAFATGISPIVSMSVCMIHYLSKNNTIRFKFQFPSFSKLIRSCATGIAGFVGEISNAITSMVFNFILLDLVGNTAVAAYGIVANISLVAIAVFNGISQGLQPMASESAGSGDKDSEKKIIRYSLKISFLLAIILVAISWIFTPGIVNLFNSENSEKMADYAITGLRLYSIGFLIASLNIVKSGFFGATGRTKECWLISVSRGIVAIVFFAFVLSMIFGIYGVWLAFLASELFTLILSFIFTKSNRMKGERK
ncbi:MAG: polysaccharide biosynthesis C-terminal domain-containing protein, partial [Ruminococcus sp.]|nr:polysaccharide biosynthesis C-terminal domain-containing protein [Ruminococcus sp.]